MSYYLDQISVCLFFMLFLLLVIRLSLKIKKIKNKIKNENKNLLFCENLYFIANTKTKIKTNIPESRAMIEGLHDKLRRHIKLKD